MTFFKLNKEISETTDDIEANDVLAVKNNLKNWGYYQEPEWGITAFSDRQMFDGIRNFQKDNNLTVDGIMKPDGETEASFNRLLEQKKQQQLNGKLQDVVQKKTIKERMFPILRQNEGDPNHPYLDIKGNLTVGLGKNIKNDKVFDSVNWIHAATRKPISKEAANEYKKAYENLPYGQNYPASFYGDKSPLWISDEEIFRLSSGHMDQDIDYLRSRFKDFDRFPPQLQNVLLDIKYSNGNLNEHDTTFWNPRTKKYETIKGWPKLFRAIREKDLQGIKDNVHRLGVHEKRNKWAVEHLEEIKNLDY